MKSRSLQLALATFGIPLLYLIGESVSWLFQSTPLIEVISRAVPDLLRILLLAWVAIVGYFAARLIWFASSRMPQGFARAAIRAVGVVVVTVICVGMGLFVTATWIPVVTVRSYPGGVLP